MPKFSGRAAVSRELKRSLRRAIDTLPSFERVIFALRHFEERPAAEIATRLGLGQRRIESALLLAAESIRARIDADPPARPGSGSPCPPHITDGALFLLAFPPAGKPGGVPRHFSSCERCSRRLAQWAAVAGAIAGRAGPGFYGPSVARVG